MAGRFQLLKTNEAETPMGVWAWAKKLVEDLNKLRKLWDLADANLTGKGLHTIRVKADETGFEITP